VRWLTDPFGYAFFVRALAAGVVVGAMCGAVSVLVVLRRMSYIGHGLSHSVLGGVAVALAAGIDLYVGAAAATVVSALLIARVARMRGLHADAAIGIVTTAMFAAGVLVVSTTAGGRVNTEALLFGNVLGVTWTDVAVVGGAALGVFGLLFAFAKPLLLVTFDPSVAPAHGVRTGAVEVLFNLLVAGVIVVSVRVLGVLLIAAAVVVPAATARLVTASLGRLFAVAIGTGAVASVVGLYASFHGNAPSGATIVLSATLLFLIAAVSAGVRQRRGRHTPTDVTAVPPILGRAPARARAPRPAAAPVGAAPSVGDEPPPRG
jgi:ABC-type Mn2+/Zn2+ transport system permease subunit